LEDSLQAGIDEMLSALTDKGYVDGDDLYYYNAPGAKRLKVIGLKEFGVLLFLCLVIETHFNIFKKNKLNISFN
jgi:hypothetical protein